MKQALLNVISSGSGMGLSLVLSAFSLTHTSSDDSVRSRARGRERGRARGRGRQLAGGSSGSSGVQFDVEIESAMREVTGLQARLVVAVTLMSYRASNAISKFHAFHTDL